MNKTYRRLGLLLALVLAACSGRIISETEVPRIDIAALQKALDTGGVVLLDVRGGPSPREPERKIPGAIVEDPDAVGTWAANYAKDQTLVLYCA